MHTHSTPIQYTHICMYTYIHTYILHTYMCNIHINAFTHAYIQDTDVIYTYIHVHINTYTHTYYIRTCSKYTYAHVLHTYINVHMHTYIHTARWTIQEPIDVFFVYFVHRDTILNQFCMFCVQRESQSMPFVWIFRTRIRSWGRSAGRLMSIFVYFMFQDTILNWSCVFCIQRVNLCFLCVFCGQKVDCAYFCVYFACRDTILNRSASRWCTSRWPSGTMGSMCRASSTCVSFVCVSHVYVFINTHDLRSTHACMMRWMRRVSNTCACCVCIFCVCVSCECVYKYTWFEVMCMCL
jgi:hypothetical protein